MTVTHSNNVNSGTASASAAYAGDGNHIASNGSATFAITPLASATVVTCPVSVGYTGAAQTPCTAVVTSADGLNQSLTATYTDNINTGTATANAAYSGDTNHAASNGSKTFAINPIPSVTVVTCPISVSYSGAAQTPCTATVTSADGLALPVDVNYTLNINVGTATATATYRRRPQPRRQQPHGDVRDHPARHGDGGDVPGQRQLQRSGSHTLHREGDSR